MLTAADRLEAADPKAEAEEAAQATLPQNRFAKSFKQFGRSVGEERRTMDADNEEPILRQGALDKDPILRRGALHTDPTHRPQTRGIRGKGLRQGALDDGGLRQGVA